MPDWDGVVSPSAEELARKAAQLTYVVPQCKHGKQGSPGNEPQYDSDADSHTLARPIDKPSQRAVIRLPVVTNSYVSYCFLLSRSLLTGRVVRCYRLKHTPDSRRTHHRLSSL